MKTYSSRNYEIRVLAEKPGGTYTPRGGRFAGQARKTTIQLQRTRDLPDGRPEWWVRWGVIEPLDGCEGGAQRYKSRKAALEAFARIQAGA